MELIEVKEEPASAKTPACDVMAREARRLMEKTDERDFVAALSDEGREFDSKAFSAFMEKRLSSGKKRLAFVIGGPFGIDSSVKERADVVLSLSKMTLAHETALLVLVEQVYRALADLKGAPYSH
jgi:23S rRNA (pseudouridine1915-N3)-methyltransferase